MFLKTFGDGVSNTVDNSSECRHNNLNMLVAISKAG